tara:strand:+ start:105 stop:416 length:312 start_codon:yes stop_codon:yes gene_type:complete
MNKLLLLITTVPSAGLAKDIAKSLVERKLAACVSLQEVNSVYSWESRIEQNKEIELKIKSTPEKLNKIIEFLKESISYEVPQLIFKLFDSEANYFNWVRESVN